MFFDMSLESGRKQPPPAEVIYNLLCPMRIRCNIQIKPTRSIMFVYTETFQLAGSFIFVHIDLKLSVKVEKFCCVFDVDSFNGIFGDEENELGDC